jgi:hypothetical protein
MLTAIEKRRKYQREWEHKHRRKNICSCGKSIDRRAKLCRSCSQKAKKGTYKWSKEARERRLAEKNPYWRGNNVTYSPLHFWIRSRLPKPQVCVNCKEKVPHDLANKTGLYTRDLNNWEWLCRKCHMEKDGRLERLKGGKNGLD